MFCAVHLGKEILTMIFDKSNKVKSRVRYTDTVYVVKILDGWIERFEGWVIIVLSQCVVSIPKMWGKRK